jgi:hypothetical protein
MITGYIVGKDELISKFSGAPGKLQGSLMKAVAGLGVELASYITENYLSGQVVKRLSGTGSRSTVSQGVEQTGGQIVATVRTGGPEAPYMKWINDGTPPHEIVPKNKKALAFHWNGKDMVLKKVQHPGIQPRHFMEDGLAAFAPRIKEKIEEAVDEALK